MSKLVDPDQLNQGTEVVFDTTAKTIQLIIAGNLSDDGVNGQTLYSFMKEEWKNDAALIMHPFPASMIDADAGKLIFGFDGNSYSGWKPKDDTTRQLLRDVGWVEYNDDGTVARTYLGVVTLGSVGAADQLYYQRELGGATLDFTYTGAVNEGVQIQGDTANGDFDTQNYFAVFTREQAKTYGVSTTVDLGETATGARKLGFAVSNGADLKITHNDTTADAYGVTIEYFSVAQTRAIGSSDYNFSVIINGNNRTAEEIYEAVQSALRKSSDIDNGGGTVIGKTANVLLSFVGDTLVTATGVYIDNFQAADTNRIEFYDTSGSKRVFPFVAAGVLNFSSTLVSDADSVYKLFKTDGFGTAQAEIVNDDTGAPIIGSITQSAVPFSYAYDAQGGTDLDVTLVCIGLSNAQYVSAEGTIIKSAVNSLVATSALERNYSNN